MLGELLFNVVAIVFRPVGEIDLVGSWFQNQRQRLIILQAAFANGIEAGKIHGFAANRAQTFFRRVDGVFHDDLLLFNAPVRKPAGLLACCAILNWLVVFLPWRRSGIGITVL